MIPMKAELKERLKDKPLFKEMLNLTIYDLLEPLRDVTEDLYIETFLDRPLQEIVDKTGFLDLDRLGNLWRESRANWSDPERGTLEGKLTGTAIEILGAVEELQNIEVFSVRHVKLINEAFKYLDENGQIVANGVPQELPEDLVVWYQPHENPRKIKCRIDGALLDLDAWEDEDPPPELPPREPVRKATDNDYYWITMEYLDEYGFTIEMEQQLNLVPKRIEKADIRIYNTEGTLNLN